MTKFVTHFSFVPSATVFLLGGGGSCVAFLPHRTTCTGIDNSSPSSSWRCAPPPVVALSSTQNYLESLTGGGAAAVTVPTSTSSSTSSTLHVPNHSHPDVAASSAIAYADADYFALDRLKSKGPRATAEWGSPADATRKLDDDGNFRVGSWFCTPGGWPSPNPKAHTEVFYMLSGHGCLGDSDGVMHYFGPGDTIVIPKGHTGRWDVHDDIHKVWAVNDHARVEEPTTPIRVKVEHYHQSAPQYLTQHGELAEDPLYGKTTTKTGRCSSTSSRTFYDVGPTKVGVWVADQPGSFKVDDAPTAKTTRRFVHVLEGIVIFTDEATGEARRCRPGDTLLLKEGWHGHVDVIEPTKKIWTTAIV